MARNIYGFNLIKREANEIGYYLYNGHGDVILIIDELNQVLNTYDYDAFGNIISETETLDNPFKYAGYYYDAESNNYYLISRYYSPLIARFISEDTYRGNLKDPLSLNRYVYVNNNPFIYVDPDGYVPIPIITGVVGGIFGSSTVLASDLYNSAKSWDWQFSSWREYTGAATQGAISFGMLSIPGANTLLAGFGGGFVGNIANQLITTGEANLSQSTISGVATAISGGLFKLMGPTNFTGNYVIDYGLKGGLTAVTWDVTNQYITNGIVRNAKGNIINYDINQAIDNYNPMQTVTAGIFGFITTPIFAKVTEISINKWGPQSTWGNPNTLKDHFKRHGKDFNSVDINDYANKANQFFKNKSQYNSFVGKDGNIRVYDPNTNTFGAYNSDGSTKSFFVPKSPHYWENQIKLWKE